MDDATLQTGMELARRQAIKHARRPRRSFDEAYGDALLGLVRAARGHDGSSHFENYAAVAIRNHLVDGVRMWAGRGGRKLHQPLERDVEAKPVSNEWETAEWFAWLRRGLPWVERLVAVLYFNEGMTQAEISTALGLTKRQGYCCRDKAVAWMRRRAKQ